METSQKTVCLVADDMFFSSKIESATKHLGIVMIKVKNHDEFRDKIEGKTVDLVIVDLASKRIDAKDIFIKLKSFPEHQETFCIGYLPHVERELASKFREKGVDLVIPRSKFSREMSEIIEEHLELK